MKFQTIGQLRQYLDKKQILHHEIKGKRLRKELASLQALEFEQFKFKQFEVTDVSINMHILVDSQGKIVEFIMRLDFEYPFNPPQIFYMGNDNKKVRYCKDLLKFILKDQIWGPSLTLPKFLQQFPQLASAVLNKSQIPTIYHQQFQYLRQQLQKSGMKLYEIQQFQWKYWIKTTKKKLLGLANDCFLIFEQISQSVLRLGYWQQISELNQVKAVKGKKQFQLQVTKLEEDKKVTAYYGGDPKYLDQILQVLNPIQMIQRKIQKFEKSGVQDNDEAIRCYSELISYYSLKKPDLTQKYMTSMKKLIAQQYENEGPKKEGQGQMVEIET